LIIHRRRKTLNIRKVLYPLRERVLQSVNHKEPDQVPCDYWGTPESDQRLMDHFSVASLEDVRKSLRVDISYIYASGIIYEEGKGLYGPTPTYIGPRRPLFEDGSFEDLWGVTRKFVKVVSGNTYREVIRNPLRDFTMVAEIESYDKWPKAEDFDYSALREECEKRKEFALILGGMPGCATVFIQCWYLRGLDQILMDLPLSPKLAHALIEKITEFQVEYHQRLLEEVGDFVDILMLADDYGTQSGLMMSQAHFREFFKKPTLQLIELGKRHDLKIMLHCDGNIRQLIPEFIEMGIDILNPIQNVGPGMDPADLKREFGKDICFHGGIDTQQVLPCLSPEEIAQEVRRKIETLGKGGGYILSPTHMVQMDVPVENLLKMYEVPRNIS
jgi:uroporphyrinogen decarboxylase